MLSNDDLTYRPRLMAVIDWLFWWKAVCTVCESLCSMSIYFAISVFYCCLLSAVVSRLWMSTCQLIERPVQDDRSALWSLRRRRKQTALLLPRVTASLAEMWVFAVIPCSTQLQHWQDDERCWALLSRVNVVVQHPRDENLCEPDLHDDSVVVFLRDAHKVVMYIGSWIKWQYCWTACWLWVVCCLPWNCLH